MAGSYNFSQNNSSRIYQTLKLTKRDVRASLENVSGFEIKEAIGLQMNKCGIDLSSQGLEQFIQPMEQY